MDGRHSDQQYSSSNLSQVNATYSYNVPQPDPFNAFVNTDDAPGFDSNWADQTFQNQPSIGHYEQTNHGWQADSYQNSSLLAAQNYASPSREFDQNYVREPATFNNYPDFEQTPVQPYATPAYDSAAAYEQIPISDRFDFPSNRRYGQSNEITISPQALQAYPTAGKAGSQPSGPNQTYAHVRNDAGSVDRLAQLQPLNRQDWAKISTDKAASISVKGLHIKPTPSFSRATNSSHHGGYYFIGNQNVALNSKAEKIAPYKRRRSRNELVTLLKIEKGDAQWHKDRKPVIKKLDEAAKKAGGPAKTSRDVSAANSGSSSESDDSESENESNSASESEGEQPSPVPLTRPTNPNKAIEYDIIKTVWAQRKTVLSGTVIRTALSECWNIFISIRDQWKAKATSLQQSIEKKDKANQKVWERRVTESRELIEACIQHTLKHGHPSIVEKLCENPHLLAVFYQFMADRIKDKEYAGNLISSMLQIIAKCNSIDMSLMEKTKMDKLLPRFRARGDSQSKALAQKIMDNAQKATKQKIAPGQTTSSTKQEPGAVSSRQSSVESTKAPKNPAVGVRQSTGQADLKAPSAKTGDNRQVNGKPDTSKVKVVQTSIKPSGFFAGLQSASKKPGTSSKSKDGRSVTESEVKNEEAKPAPKATFSFAATMANLQKQKESPLVKVEDNRKVETSEEKKKRLRRESRRGLRVSFKADDDLVQTRTFVHDPEEEMGHEDSQVRDVMDSKGEGQTLKMHKDVDFMDEDEDYEPPEDFEPLSVWSPPQPVDFGPIENLDVPLDSLYKKRGGTLEPNSPERLAQEQRERDTLMVVYATNADVPLNPRDPPDAGTDQPVQEQKMGEPLSDSFVKTREAEYRANRYNQPSAMMPQATGLSMFLQNFNSGTSHPQQPQPQVTTEPAVADQAATNLANIQAILAQVTGNQQPSPVPMAQPSRSIAPTFNLQAAMTNAAPSGFQHQYQPNQTFDQPPPAQGSVDLQALLRNLSGQGATQAAPLQDNGYNLNTGQHQSENDRKRQLDEDDLDEYGQGKRAKIPGREEKKPYVGIPTVACRFFQEGKCRKGAECTFLHIME